jgi:chromate transporter
MVRFRDIFFLFLKLGAFTFGGGYAMIPIIREEIIKKGWIEESIFLDYIAIAQVSPGMIAVNIAVLTGSHLKKRLGAIVAVLGVMIPSIVVIIIIAALFENFNEIVWVQKALNGILLVVILLLGKSVYSIGTKAIKHYWLYLYSLAIFLLVTFAGFTTAYAIVLAFVSGSIHYLISRKLGDQHA